MEESTHLAYLATAISFVARGIFVYLLYTRKSTNNLSLTFCILNVGSSCLWLQYSLTNRDLPLLVRSSGDVAIFTMAASYIVNNKRLLSSTVSDSSASSS